MPDSPDSSSAAALSPSTAVSGSAAGIEMKPTTAAAPGTTGEAPLIVSPSTTAAAPQHKSSVFKVDPKSLQKLVDPKNKAYLDEIGGVDGLCKSLQVDPSVGLSAAEKFPMSAEEEQEITALNRAVQPGFFARFFSEEEPPPYDTTKFLHRAAHFGHNALPPVRQRTIFQYMFLAIQDKILILLTCTAMASIIVGLVEDFVIKEGSGVEWVEGLAIIVAVMIVVFVQSANDYKKEIQFRKLNSKKEMRKVKALRDGQVVQISVYDVQVGEVLLVEPGDVLNVDGVLIQAHNLKMDESSATGESDLINKQAYSPSADCKDPFALGGGKVNEGVGRFVVTAVGVNSFYGKTMLGLRVETEDTPLQVKLNALADSIAGLGIAVAVLLFVVLITKFIITQSIAGWDKISGGQIAHMIISIFIQTIIIIVVAVPEGLPLAVTLALAYATKRMTKDNNLVRVLASCETMGGATTICSDKTGTLTQNKMTVVAGLIGHRLEFKESHGLDMLKEKLKISNSNLVDPASSPAAHAASMTPAEFLNVLADGIAMNSTAFEEADQTGKMVFVGNKTESALLEFIRHLGLQNFQQVRDDSIPLTLQVYPFSSERKSMSIVVKRLSKGEPVYRVYTKGASEIILGFADSILEFDGKESFVHRNMTEEYRNDVLAVIGSYADSALRTLSIGFREYTEQELQALIGDFHGADGKFKPLENAQSQALEKDFSHHVTMLGIVGIEDPLRPGVSEAVAKCQKAGVFVRMVTGDNVRTAKAIATKCGIYMKGGIVMEGSRFRHLSDEDMDAIVPRLQVLARSSPTDKQILVRKLKEMQETVAVTGDGTNDGPALKMADVGFSMGIAGTEVAKEASSIILMDDNFSSIVKAMMWGRSVNDSVKKFLQFQLSVNVSAVLLTFISAVSSNSNESVLTAVQLLWINLIMDTLAALALATDPPTEALLDRWPEGKRSPLISVPMWKMIIGQSIFQVAAGLAIFYLGENMIPAGFNNGHSPKEIVGTMVFNTFVFFQVFNEINCRRVDSHLNIFAGIHRNTFFQVIFVVVIVVQVILVQFGGVVFECYGLPGAMWAYSILIASLTLPLGVAIRMIPNWDGCTVCGVSVAVPDNERVVMTKERLQWQHSIGQVRTSISVFRALRGSQRPGTSQGNSSIQDLDKVSIASSPSERKRSKMSSEAVNDFEPSDVVAPQPTFNREVLE
eukprot:Partr_v1_DN28270_c3_g1_i4_m75374 putative ATPase, Ca transporting, plasma membrane